MRDQIIADIRRLAEANGGQPPGVQAFESATGVSEGSWRGKYWARWSDALVEAGYQPNQFQGRSEANHILISFIAAIRHHKRVPSVMELRMFKRGRADFPNEKTIQSYFGSKQALVAGLREWIKDKPDYNDIVEIIRDDSEHAEPVAKAKEGLVYLIKSGAHYKIGRSDELERRVKEIRIALPEAATLVHAIRTDDPAGIESYWHRRFADRRANGEWFKLTAADVAAFKRRKYQ